MLTTTHSTKLRHRFGASQEFQASLATLRCDASALPDLVAAEAAEHPALVIDHPHYRTSLPLESTAAAPETLEQVLCSQLRALRLSVHERRLAVATTFSLDDDGYCRASLDEIAHLAGVPADPDACARARQTVQQLDPPGVAARDLQECLLLQLARKEEPIALLARQIVETHLQALAAGDTDALARELSESPSTIARAIACIRRLDPAPGLRFHSSVARALTMDLVIQQDDGEWHVDLCDDRIPRARINRRWHDWARDAESRTGRFATTELRHAEAVLQRIARRRVTLLSLMRFLLQAQPNFSAGGPSRLTPVRLSDAAVALGLAESTISRAIHGKWVSTPWGPVTLKEFFLASACAAATTGRRAVAELIRGEDPAAPLSDGAIAVHLTRTGTPITRRTVANHRAALGIAAASARRCKNMPGPPC